MGTREAAPPSGGRGLVLVVPSGAPGRGQSPVGEDPETRARDGRPRHARSPIGTAPKGSVALPKAGLKLKGRAGTMIPRQVLYPHDWGPVEVKRRRARPEHGRCEI